MLFLIGFLRYYIHAIAIFYLYVILFSSVKEIQTFNFFDLLINLPTAAALIER